ncbi:LysR family transcriptional regulator [Kitasatospora sp. NPDC096147]|uniref:LysR family transcriptional regulator n=1 Tax=Kitasatospora sp. NPDC096147 TaxID=3364093 RepID=UPI0037F27117
MLTLRQLEYLVTIVEQGSFTRAAELLHVSQPALSHQVRVMEGLLGGPLLERLPRQVRATPMGRAVLPHARAALAEAGRAVAAGRDCARAGAGEVELATLYGYSLGLLPAVLRVWHRERPGATVRLREYRHAEELAEAVAGGVADLALGPQPQGWAGPLWELGEEEFLLVLPADDPSEVAAGGELELRSLAGRSWVHYAAGNGLADLLDQVCGAAGFRPVAAVRTEQTAAGPLLASAGLGPTLAAAHALPPGLPGRLHRPLPPVRRQLAVYARNEPDPLTAELVATVRREAVLLPEHVRERLTG